MKRASYWGLRQRLEQRIKMDKQKIVAVMLESINNDNRMMAAGLGMSEQEIEDNIQKSQQGLEFMLGNAFDKVIEEGLIG